MPYSSISSIDGSNIDVRLASAAGNGTHIFLRNTDRGTLLYVPQLMAEVVCDATVATRYLVFRQRDSKGLITNSFAENTGFTASVDAYTTFSEALPHVSGITVARGAPLPYTVLHYGDTLECYMISGVAGDTITVRSRVKVWRVKTNV